MKNYSKLVHKLRSHVPGSEENLGKRILFWALAIIVGFVLLGTITIGGLFAILSIGLPDVSDLEKLSGAQSTQIFDSKDALLYTIHGEENREYIPFKNISTDLVNATVSIEDDQFWTHNGFDLTGIASGILYEIFGIGTPRGGSTITQQYVKNAFLSPERSYIRKIKELILALRVERAYDKQTILELYLNRIPYGNNAYGIKKAAEIYLNKSPKDLTLAEAGILAALPQGPTKYNPYGSNKYSHLLKEFSPEELFVRKIKSEADLKTEEYVRGLIGANITLTDNTKIYIPGRSDLVLARMEALGYITKDKKEKAVEETKTIKFAEFKEEIKHPHFVFYIKQMLEDKYGKDVVEQGGLKVYTTLNSELQEYAEKTAEEKCAYNEKAFGANNCAIFVINAKTGDVLAMVGSRDYYNDDIDGKVNVVLRPRQPGSSFKPIVYAQAFYNGYGPGSVIYDVPIKFGSDIPQNYDGKYLGQMSIRRALGQSRNLPAIQAYFLAGSQDKIIELAEKMGIHSLDKTHSYGYPLALGAGEVSLYEMVSAYSVFANTGKKVEISPIVKIENTKGDIIEQRTPEITTTTTTSSSQEEVLDPQVAFLINSILSDNSVKVGPNLIIDGHTLATKTGTSTKENKKEAGGAVAPADGWTIGYTPSITMGVWVGNTDGSPMALHGSGYDEASGIFKAVMAKAISGLPEEPFPEPEGIKHIAISTASGLLPGPNTPASFIREEVFASFAVPTETDNSFYRVKIDKISGKLATEYTPKDAVEEVLFVNHKSIAPYENWQIAINNWYKGMATKEQTAPETSAENPEGLRISFGVPPTEYDDIHTATSSNEKPQISIESPSANKILKEGGFEVRIKETTLNGVDRVEFYIDDELKHIARETPYIGYLRISKFITTGRHLIRAKVIDKLGYSAEAVIEVKVDR